ncbi:MAG: sterol desaturase family protein [Polyangia bacterium]
MDARLIAVAIPVFFVLIAVERIALRGWRDPVYRLHDAIADLSCGIGQQTLQVFLYVVELGVYTWLFTRFHVLDISPRSPVAWVVLWLAVDVAYYWFHRASHRINFLWAVHGVHHQSEEYNLAVALRQGWVEPLVIAPFHWPLALLGFPPAMFFTVFTLHTLWQFWPHTRGIGRLGVLDGIFNTPSNHRCHHAINPPYIDKNYGGFLILWDRLFGTWAKESEAPAFGTVKPLKSWNPLWANLSYWAEIGAIFRASPRLVDKLQAFVRPPEWRPAALGGPVSIPEVTRDGQRRYEVHTSRALDIYTTVAFALVALAVPVLTQARAGTSWLALVLAATFVIVSIVAVAGLVESKRWARSLEVVRLLALPAVAWVFSGMSMVAAIAGGVAIVQLVWFVIWTRGSAR